MGKRYATSRPQLTDAEKQDILDRLARGDSRRKVAKDTGHGRSTVDKVAKLGVYKNNKPQKNRPKPKYLPTPEEIAAAAERISSRWSVWKRKKRRAARPKIPASSLNS